MGQENFFYHLQAEFCYQRVRYSRVRLYQYQPLSVSFFYHFQEAPPHLYNRVCPSVGPSVHPPLCLSVIFKCAKSRFFFTLVGKGKARERGDGWCGAWRGAEGASLIVSLGSLLASQLNPSIGHSISRSKCKITGMHPLVQPTPAVITGPFVWLLAPLTQTFAHSL